MKKLPSRSQLTFPKERISFRISFTIISSGTNSPFSVYFFAESPASTKKKNLKKIQ